MASSFKQDNPGCDCCGLNCEDCDAVTYFTISITEPTCSGTPDPNPGHCSRNNGTYVFRTVGSQTGDSCSWIVSPLGGGSCDTGSEIIKIQYGTTFGGTYPCGSFSMSAIIEFVAVTGGVQVSVYLQYAYIKQSYTPPFPVQAATHQFLFRDTFATCADAIGATLPFVSDTVNVCSGSDPGDYCNVAGATVTIG